MHGVDRGSEWKISHPCLASCHTPSPSMCIMQKLTAGRRRRPSLSKQCRAASWVLNLLIGTGRTFVAHGYERELTRVLGCCTTRPRYPVAEEKRLAQGIAMKLAEDARTQTIALTRPGAGTNSIVGPRTKRNATQGRRGRAS